MEAGWRSDGHGADYSGGHNSTTLTPLAATRYASHDRVPEGSVIHALLFGTTFHDAGVEWDSIPHGKPNRHMMCLKQGKRHYSEDAVIPDCLVTAESSPTTKRGKPPYPCYVTGTTTTAAGTTTTRWPASPRVKVTSCTRCQVEGCNVALGDAKEYYRRHKVCEIHSKAPSVVVSGLPQRFCQQCSRFHDVREFDEAKRSCRRRLEGHNLRRRKGALSISLPQNFPHSHENTSMMKPRLGHTSTLPSPSPSSSQSKPVCAPSLLSNPTTEPWISSGDWSFRRSAAPYMRPAQSYEHDA